MNGKEFWAHIDRALDRIESTKPQTFDAVKAILDEDGNPEVSLKDTKAKAFFGGSGGDRSLWAALTTAGWETSWMEESFFYGMRHPVTGESLQYVEGDVYQGDER